jgi:hypothetical protein
MKNKYIPAVETGLILCLWKAYLFRIVIVNVEQAQKTKYLVHLGVLRSSGMTVPELLRLDRVASRFVKELGIV